MSDPETLRDVMRRLSGLDEVMSINARPGHQGFFDIPVSERLAMHSRQDGECIIWTGALTQSGYGRLCIKNGGPTRAHRVAYVLTNGEIPKGMVIDHLCRNRACVNPKHLEAVTTAENNKRARAHQLPRPHKPVCKWGHRIIGENAVPREGGRLRCRKCRDLALQKSKQLRRQRHAH